MLTFIRILRSAGVSPSAAFVPGRITENKTWKVTKYWAQNYKSETGTRWLPDFSPEGQS